MPATSELSHKASSISAGYYVFLALILSGTALAYYPGLGGPFVFDDFSSLARLGDLGGVRDWTTFKAYVLGGRSGPTGRPLSLLSFLLDGTTWPTEAFPFKRTNLVIHLMTGIALFLTTYEIARLCQRSADSAARIAIAVSAVWLLHPFLVSTTLYAVQRMAQLATFFSVTGLYIYLRGRILLDTRTLLAYLLMSTGAGAFTALAVLSKENGVLLPLLIGVAELTILASRRETYHSPNRLWSLTFIVVPTIVVCTYLVNYVAQAGLFSINIARGYSIYERLLTESRVLVDYLLHWFIPLPSTSGVFQDHVQHSSGWLDPPTTLLSALLHAIFIGLAIKFRKHYPAASFAILFFYLAQLLESTVINLELYFEHRNYLAAAFLVLPLVMLAERHMNGRMFFGTATAVLAVLAAFTANSAYIWRSYDSMVEAAARAEPLSARAQQQYAIQLYNSGDSREGFRVIEEAIERLPEDAPLKLSRVILLCQSRSLSAGEFARLRADMRGKPYDPRLLATYELLSQLVFSNQCPPVSAPDVNSLFEDMMLVESNMNTTSLAFHQVQYLLGLADIQLENPDLAFDHLKASLESRPRASRAMLMASLMANAGYYAKAMTFTEMAIGYRDPARALSVDQVSVQEIRDFKDRLRSAMDGEGTDNPPE